jgi:23S rRNA (uracil1939-C5)-methyltransferase
MAADLKPYDGVVVDPPRLGAEAQARQLALSKVQRIAYVSCFPASFASDARVLIDGGFRLTRVTPIDQFLWSHHVELVGVFKR